MRYKIACLLPILGAVWLLSLVNCKKGKSDAPVTPVVQDTIPKPGVPAGYVLDWSDEFNVDGKPDPTKWGYEIGFVRNLEDQWYTDTNAVVSGGFLTIQARKTYIPNPKYNPSSTYWTQSRE